MIRCKEGSRELGRQAAYMKFLKKEKKKYVC